MHALGAPQLASLLFPLAVKVQQTGCDMIEKVAEMAMIPRSQEERRERELLGNIVFLNIIDLAGTYRKTVSQGTLI